MGGPFDFTINSKSIADALLGGMQFGQNMRAGEQNMAVQADENARAQAAADQQATLFGQQQAEYAGQLEAQKAMQADLAALAGKIETGQFSSADFAAMTAKYPDLANQMSGMWEGLSGERKAADVADLFKGVSAIKAGRPDLAIAMLEERAAAAERSGDQMEADVARATAAAIEANPAAGLTSLGILLQSVDPEAASKVFGAEPDKPAAVAELEWRAEQAGLVPGTKEYQDFVRTGGKTAPIPGTTTIAPDGTVTITKLTESEGKATGFFYRMEESDKTLSALENQGTSLWNKTAGGIPVLGNYMVSADAQRFDQAKRDFINALLRRESGAVISPEEFANAEVQYFPQPGDGPDVIAQKARNRKVAIDGVKASAGEGALTAPSPAGDPGSPGPTGQEGAAAPSFDDAFSKYGAAP